MIKKSVFLAILTIGLTSSVTVGLAETSVPGWMKTVASFWCEGLIPDSEFVSGIQYLIDNRIILISSDSGFGSIHDIPSWVKNNACWYSQDLIKDSDFAKGIEFLVEKGIIQVGTLSYEGPSIIPNQKKPLPSLDCKGYARCFVGDVSEVVDGDTIKVDGKSIRFALASAPEWFQNGGPEATEFIETICPVGSAVLVDEDDGQTQGSYGRIIGVIYCNGYNLNEELLDAGLGSLSTVFCYSSEFEYDDWAQKHGCENEYGSRSSQSSPSQTTQDCDPSYPDFCIPPPPPDLDCRDMSQKRFTVLPPDPHGFDGDKDGIGCES